MASIIKLVKNYRSHGSIVAFSNRFYYEDELRASARREITTSLFGSPVLQSPRFPVVFHGILDQDELSGHSQSYFNIGEASLVKTYCLQLVNDLARHVGEVHDLTSQLLVQSLISNDRTCGDWSHYAL